MIFEIFLLFTTLLVVAYLYIQRTHTYWAKRNVPYVELTSSIWGNMQSPFTSKRGIKGDVKNGYDELKKRGLKHGGMYLFTQAIYIPVDLELIKSVLTKDFQYFMGRGMSIDEKHDPLSGNLLNLDGEKWKNMRSKLTPTFTSGKMKQMFDTLLQCGNPLLEHIEKLCQNKDILDIKDICACYTTDVIGSCVFGLDCRSFKDPNAEFRKYGRKTITPRLETVLFQFALFAAPALSKLIKVKVVADDVQDFFMNTLRNIFNYRRTNNVKRNDFVELFLEMERKAKESNQSLLTFNEIAAQSLIFFIAGFETSSSTMTMCLHELAFKQDIQDRLRAEIRETVKKHDGKLTYGGIMEMKYMDQVVNETLRKYPIIPILLKKCYKDYKVPDTDVTIEAGTSVMVSTMALHADEEYFPNPKKFDPERFNEENRSSIPQYAFLPFGEGPKNCIGMRFGLMQTKTGLSMLLNNYKFLPVEGQEYDFEIHPQSFIVTKKGTLMLRAEKL